jgi:Pyruvate/2-oxoacid:ferredoxin oxidoreductase gamma subunit
VPIDRHVFEAVIRDLLPSRTMDENLRAFERGGEVVEERMKN